MEPQPQAQFHNIHSYAGGSIANPSKTIQFNMSDAKGFSAFIRNSDTVSIINDPITVAD